jgi:hypothetical protein
MSEEFELEDEAKSYVMIDEEMRLAITPRNWQLQKKSIALSGKNEGKVTWVAFRYYTSLNSALNDIMHIKMAQETFRTAKGMLEANQRVMDNISKAFDPEYRISKAA